MTIIILCFVEESSGYVCTESTEDIAIGRSLLIEIQ